MNSKEIDALILAMAGEQPPFSLHQWTHCMAYTPEPFQWQKEGIEQVWDFASTGGITNISPIIGYLWLKTRAEQLKQGDRYPMVVPKISSTGRSGGTVDILKAGGANFVDDAQEIIKQCKEKGGVLCQQSALTPVDKKIMDRRRKINQMKNARLVYASIVGKKMALGCTHTIIDVKLGQDSKMIAPWLSPEQNNELLKLDRDCGLLPDKQEQFIALLKSMGIEQLEIQNGYIVQHCPPDLSPLKTIYWHLSNNDYPQSRAIGRQLTLLHLEQIMQGQDDLWQQGDYHRWYLERMPQLCQVDSPSMEQLKEQWQQLNLKKLPDLELLPFIENNKYQEDHWPIPAKNTPIHVQNFKLYPYQPYRRPVKILSINTKPLDKLFKAIGGEDHKNSLADKEGKDQFEPVIGIWLHKLPGEILERPQQDPLISVIYHDESKKDLIQEKIAHFIHYHVRVQIYKE